MKILMSGAHLTPALAMIDHIKQHHQDDEVFFVGRLYSQEKLKQKAVEKDEVESRGVTFIPFRALKFVNYGLLARLQTIVTFPQVVLQARHILQKHQIDVFLSFGSYLAVPFALAAKSLGIKVVTHEQTFAMGKANQFIACFADKVALSYIETREYLSRPDAVITGNPIRLGKNKKRPAWLKNLDKPLLLIMGGNQGSFLINDMIAAHLETLLKDYVVVHQCGRSNQLKDSAKELNNLRDRLPADLADRYYIQEWIKEEDLFWLYEQTFFAISRSGANAVLELSMAAVPAILIPLANTHNQEQLRNAQLMERRQGAVIIEQDFFNDNTFLQSLSYMKQQAAGMHEQLKRLNLPNDATAKLYQLLL
jgi:UDP-N-acetylglucosamine--N-acetylmuramyl-(pentapeptide) pyrophosphoryl-undecaprenol N-acetylglucosamine transferase